MSRCRLSPTQGERGSATVLMLVVVAALISLAVGAASVGGVLVAQRRAEAAADLAALAAADALAGHGWSAAGNAPACLVARAVSSANHGRLTGCLVQGRVVVVGVVVDVSSPFGGSWSVPGRARAGPGSSSPAGGEPTGDLVPAGPNP